MKKILDSDERVYRGTSWVSTDKDVFQTALDGRWEFSKQDEDEQSKLVFVEEDDSDTGDEVYLL